MITQETKLIEQIKTNLTKVQIGIQKAADSVGRDPASVKLVVVTKRMPINIVQAAIKCGLRCFGENYAEEGVEKIKALGDQDDLEWHMVGHVQSRKAGLVCAYYDLLQSLDRLKLARLLDRGMAEQNAILPALLEFNVSGEESKYGLPAADEDQWEELLPVLKELQHRQHLLIEGLMTMPPLFRHPEEARPYFKRLKKLQSFLIDNLPEFSWRELSMGTSSDYEVAVEEGATIIRIGEAILGPRPERK